jgi:hypothetical protein
LVLSNSCSSRYQNVENPKDVSLKFPKGAPLNQGITPFRDAAGFVEALELVCLVGYDPAKI